MNPGSQKGIKLAMGGIGLCALFALAFALVGLNLPPLLILGVTIAGIALPIFVLRPEAGLHLFLILTFFESAGGANQSVTVGKAAGALILAGWLLSVAVSRRLHLKVNTVVLSLMAFTGIAALSIMEAYDNQVAVRQTLTYAQLVLVMTMVTSVVRTPEAIRRVLRTLVVGTTIAATYGLMQYSVGIAKTTAGFIGNRNLMATYLTFAIPCAYLLYQMSRNGIERLAIMIALSIQFLALALTFSRTGIIGLSVIIVVLGYRLARHQGLRILAATSIIIVLIMVVLPEEFYKRIESIGPSMQHQEETFGQRIELAEAGIRMVTAHPILGVGAGNYSVVLARYGRSGYTMSGQWASHNTYVGVAAETGLPAAALFFLAIGAAFRYLWATIRFGREHLPEVALLAIAIEGSLVAFMVSALSGNFEKTKFLYVFLGLALSIEGVRQRMTAPAPAVAAPEETPALAGGLVPAP